MFKKILSITLAAVLILGLAAPALAVGPTFSDVPETYWGYADIEAVAEAGLMNGTGNGEFSPEMKVSVAQFLTLLGRLVFPETKVGEADSWYGPYVSAAQSAGLLTGTQVDTGNVEAEISRYDMAVILRAAAKKLGVAEKNAQSGEVTDYLDIPTRYADAVLAVYGMGLIRGDQGGCFNGTNTMMRAEVATVIMRLAKAKPGSSQGGGAEPTKSPTPSIEPEKPTESEKSVESQAPDMVHVSLEVVVRHPVPYSQAIGSGSALIYDSAPFKLLYTEDGGKTSTVVGEGHSQSYTPGSSWDGQTIEFDVDRNVVKAGAGEFYLSGEMDYEGVHYATHDLRTDGRATVISLDMNRVLEGFVTQKAEVVPAATGYQRIVTLNRYYGRWHIQGNLKAQCRYYPDSEVPTPDGGILLAEAPVDEEGNYHMEFKIDSIDYDLTLPAYKIYIFDADTGELVGNGSALSSLQQLTSMKQGTVE